MITVEARADGVHMRISRNDFRRIVRILKAERERLAIAATMKETDEGWFVQSLVEGLEGTSAYAGLRYAGDNGG